MKLKIVKISETKRDAYRVSFPSEMLNTKFGDCVDVKRLSEKLVMFEIGKYGCKVRFNNKDHKPFVHFPKKYYGLKVGEYRIVSHGDEGVLIRCE